MAASNTNPTCSWAGGHRWPVLAAQARHGVRGVAARPVVPAAPRQLVLAYAALATRNVEFYDNRVFDPQAIARQFVAMGFTAVAKHRSKNVVRYRQGDINFILNMEPRGPAAHS